jgi:hypothetical protein
MSATTQFMISLKWKGFWSVAAASSKKWATLLETIPGLSSMVLMQSPKPHTLTLSKAEGKTCRLIATKIAKGKDKTTFTVWKLKPI